jgi:cellulose synthase operon protein YhjQ
VPLVIISGQRGGAGATTVVSNLAASLQNAGEQTLSIDLHPDNQLCLHFGVSQECISGWAQAIATGADWKQCAFQASDGRRVLPFGELAPYQFKRFREVLMSSIKSIADTFALRQDEWVLIDMPVDRQQALSDNLISECYQAIYALADFSFYVAHPDLGTYRLLKQAALNGETLADKQLYLLNEVDTNSALSLDIELLVKAEFAAQVLPASIHRDTAVPEAAAYMTAVNTYMPSSQASSDYHSLALWCLGRLGEDAENA